MADGTSTERESVCVYVAGIPERIGALKSLVVSRFEPQPPAWQASALSIALCPSGFKYGPDGRVENFSDGGSPGLGAGLHVAVELLLTHELPDFTKRDLCKMHYVSIVTLMGHIAKHFEESFTQSNYTLSIQNN